MVEMHPDTRNALAYSDSVENHFLTYLDKMRALTTKRISKDRDIAVKVDCKGELVELWFKPGILDRKTAKVIASELTRLITAATSESAEAIAELFAAAHRYPSFEDVVADEEKKASARTKTPQTRG